MRPQRLLLGLLSTDNNVPRAWINPSQNRLLNQRLWQAVIINAAISMQRLGMFTGCNSWLNKEGIFGRPCGMGHCFAERWNEIRALTLHQTLFALHDWKGPGWQHKAALLQTPPCNTIELLLSSWIIFTDFVSPQHRTAPPAKATMHHASTEWNPDTTSNVPQGLSFQQTWIYWCLYTLTARYQQFACLLERI